MSTSSAVEFGSNADQPTVTFHISIANSGSRGRTHCYLRWVAIQCCLVISKRRIPQFRIVALIPLLISSWPGPVFPQDLNLRIDRISLEQGLSQSTVNAIIQDRQGFMWFGTEDGLNRYDGYDFVVYKNDPFDSNSISDSRIMCLHEDDGGDIWVGTFRGGLNRYVRVEDRFIRYKHDPANPRSLSGNSVSAIEQDSAGTIWIGLWGGGLSRYDPNTNSFLRYRHDPTSPRSLGDDRVTSICVGRDGGMWVGTWGGVHKQNVTPGEGESSSFAPFDRIGNYSVTRIYEDKSGCLWVGTLGSGVIRYDEKTNELSAYHHEKNNMKSFSSGGVKCILEDSKGDLWIGTYGGGLNRFDRATNTFFHFQAGPENVYSLKDNYIFSLCEDRTGRLWIGTGASGLGLHHPDKRKFVHHFQIPSVPHSLSNNVVRALAEDSRGDLWVGTLGGGLDRYDKENGGFVHFRYTQNRSAGIASNSILSLMEDRFGFLWIGTDNEGLDRYDRRSGDFAHYRNIPGDSLSLSDNAIFSTYEDRAGYLWVGTAKGLNRFDRNTQRFEQYYRQKSNPNSLSGNWIYSIYEDRRGFLWIGTWGSGLTRYDRRTGTFKHFKPEPHNSRSMSDLTVFAIVEDSNENLWLGTANGLNQYVREDDRFAHFTEKDGLPNNVVYGILPDDAGNLWLSTNNGLCKFNPETHRCQNYDIFDGLQSNEFNQGAYCRSKGGQMFFGGINGFNAFYPDSIRMNTNIPPIVLTSFRVFDKPVRMDRSAWMLNDIQLSYNDNFFSFEFAALDYAAPQKNRYAYMLEGFDRDWIYSGTRRYASYTNLDGGEYVFRVKGSNNDDVWNEQGVSVRITIIPPFWRTWWFTLTSAFTIVAIGFQAYRYRVGQLLKVERMRARIATDLHDDIGASLSRIALFSEVAKEEASGTSPRLYEMSQKIGDNARELLDAVGTLVWSIDPRHDRFQDVLTHMKNFAQEMFSAKGIDYTLEIKPEVEKFQLSLEARKNLLLIFKEAVNNIIRHADCRTAMVNMAIENGSLQLKVIDDGKGILDEQTRSGHGLANMQIRAKSMGGELSVQTIKGTGTSVLLQVPTQRR